MTKERIPLQKSGPQTVKIKNTEVRIYRQKCRGHVQHLVSYYVAGRRVRKGFFSASEAKEHARKAATLIEAGKMGVLRMTDSKAETAVHAERLIAATGVPLISAIEEWLAARSALAGKCSIIAAANEYAERHGSRITEATVPVLFPEFIQDKGRAGFSHDYLGSLRLHLRPFAERFRVNISTIRTNDVNDYLRSLDVAPRTRNNTLTSLKTFFTWARDIKGALPKNTPTEAEPIEKVKSKGGAIGILRPAQLAKLLAAADNPERKVFASLAAFTGLRAEELNRVQWPDIQVERGFIEVRAENAKTAARRLVPIVPALASWLRPHLTSKNKGRLFSSPRYAEHFTVWARKVIGEWPQNAMRHSFISYRLATTQSAAQVALEAGNSAQIIFKHYRELVTPAEAEEWFSIAPVNVIHMKKRAV